MKMYMKLEDGEEQGITFMTGAGKVSDLSVVDSSIFNLNTGVNLSAHTLKLAHELGTMSLGTYEDQNDYLLKTPNFANSVFADAAVTAIRGNSYDTVLAHSAINADVSAYYTSNSGFTPLITHAAFVNPAVEILNNLTFSPSVDISGILGTGIAIEGVNSILSNRFNGGDITPSPAILNSNRSSLGIIAGTQSIFETPAFQDTFQSIKTDFIVGNKHELEERFVMALERANDLTERKLDIEDRKTRIEEKKEAYYMEMKETLKIQQEVAKKTHGNHGGTAKNSSFLGTVPCAVRDTKRCSCYNLIFR
jgi:hypothetical protein